jgi:hypothetical protein
MRTLLIASLLLCLMPQDARGVQIAAGSPEDKAFQEITAETDGDAKLQRLTEFEKQFPRSRVLAHVYLMIIDLYRAKNDPDRMIEFAEKVLKVDDRNVTAMMVLSRNYAIQRRNLDRSVELAQKAVEEVGKMRTSPVPSTHTETQWKEYLDNTEASARSILTYTMRVRGQ